MESVLKGVVVENEKEGIQLLSHKMRGSIQTLTRDTDWRGPWSIWILRRQV